MGIPVAFKSFQVELGHRIETLRGLGTGDLRVHGRRDLAVPDRRRLRGGDVPPAGVALLDPREEPALPLPLDYRFYFFQFPRLVQLVKRVYELFGIWVPAQELSVVVQVSHSAGTDSQGDLFLTFGHA
jgi:hypothetical protein